MKSFTFRLPVKMYIQKYLTSLYGETIPAKMETDIGFVVLNILASRLETKVCRGYNNQFDNPYQGIITFTVPFCYFSLTKKEITVFTRILLNRFLENKFELDMMLHVDRSLHHGASIKSAIEEFAQKHNIDIEEDISFDALKKMEYRHRKKNIEIFSRRLSPERNLFTQGAA